MNCRLKTCTHQQCCPQSTAPDDSGTPVGWQRAQRRGPRALPGPASWQRTSCRLRRCARRGPCRRRRACASRRWGVAWRSAAAPAHRRAGSLSIKTGSRLCQNEFAKSCTRNFVEAQPGEPRSDTPDEKRAAMHTGATPKQMLVRDVLGSQNQLAASCSRCTRRKKLPWALS